MANEKNLEKGIPTRFVAGEEQVKIARMGGRARVAQVRRRKTMREWAEVIGSTKVSFRTADGRVPEGADAIGAAVMAMYAKAMKGDVAAFRELRDLLGELVQKIDVRGDISKYPLTDEEIEAYRKLRDAE